MYSELINLLKCEPAVYETTGIAFWDDEHISKSMLQAHLTPDADGASRKHAFIAQSAEWISTLKAPGKRLLDLGCGPGLYAEAFTRNNFQVTGIDFSRRSIEYAKQSAQGLGMDIEYHYQDYLTIACENSFDVAVLLYCDFGVLPPDDRKMLLEKVYAALKPGGLFIVDVWSSNQYVSFSNCLKTSYGESGFWRAEPYVCIQRDKRYEGNHFLEQYIVITENECLTYNLWNHAFTPTELTRDLQEAGFDSIEIYGDASGKVFETEDITICAVGKK